MFEAASAAVERREAVKAAIRRAKAMIEAQAIYRPSAREIERHRNRAMALACSEYWIVAKLHGHQIPTGQPHPHHLLRDDAIHPKTPCRCANCRGRRQWPGNAYVSGAGIAYDCIVEQQPVDEGMEELLAPLRGASGSFIDERAMRSAHRRGRSM